MLLSKAIGQITYGDVVEFCNKGLPESHVLDYKQNWPGNLAKTIAAMANTYGGHIIIGVGDEDDMPKPPFEGIPYEDGFRRKVDDIVADTITPPVYTEVRVSKAQNSDNTFVVIRIPPSTATPHRIGETIYVRTGQRAKQESAIHPDQLPWLFNARRKSEELKELIYSQSDSRLENYLRYAFGGAGQASSIPRPAIAVSLIPVYPFRPLFRVLDANSIFDNARVKHGFIQIPDGSLVRQGIPGGIAYQKGRIEDFDRLFEYWELTQFGHVVCRRNLGTGYSVEFGEALEAVLSAICFGLSVYQETGFYGSVELRCRLHNLQGCIANVSESAKMFSPPGRLIDSDFSIFRHFTPYEVREDSGSLAADVLREVANGIDYGRAAEGEITAQLRRWSDLLPK